MSKFRPHKLASQIYDVIPTSCYVYVVINSYEFIMIQYKSLSIHRSHVVEQSRRAVK